MTNIDQNIAFAWSAVIALSLQLWVMLPITYRKLSVTGRRLTKPLTLVVVIYLFVMALQVVLAEPVITHRIVSVFCLCYGAAYVIAIAGDKDFQDSFAPVGKDEKISLAFRLHYLRLKALFILLALVVNEALVFSETELSTRIAVFAILPLLLHYLFAITLRITSPPFEDT